MITISKAVKSILDQDEDALIAANLGILDITTYSKYIKGRVDEMLYKKVPQKTIAVSLYRIIDSYKNQLESHVELTNITIWPNLELITVDNTNYNRSKITQYMHQIDGYHSTIMGVNEITVILQKDQSFKLCNLLKSIKYNFKDLNAIIISFNSRYIDTPGLIYIIAKRLAVHNINVIEIVSTSTELTVIVDKTDLTNAVQLLGKFI